MKTLFLLVLLLAACIPITSDSACPECTPCTQSHKHTEYEAEAYYRGVYSLCMLLNAKALEGGATRFVDCTEMVKVAHDLKWHEREAPGFEWPPEETSGLDNTARNYVK